MTEHDPSFSFDLDRRRDLLTIKFVGFWTLDTVSKYEEARRLEIREGGVPSSRLRILVDRRGQSAQAQNVVNEMARIISDNSSIAQKTAVLFDSALHRRQSDRINPLSVRTFDNELDAVAWLDERTI